MIRNIISLVLFFTFALSYINCSDDDNRGRQRRSPEEQANALQDELNLTNIQTEQIKEIYTKAREEMSKLRDSFDGDRSEMRYKMRELRENLDEQILGILDDNQKKEYQRIQEERRDRMREWRNNRE